ncbi:AraC family transcriptional regulator [Gracilibacillus sp. YIM 98692]|uniref:helix-turn-helix domain-containing protein n=1 Tax=Gracilibacillus sp. YIM 98692 TaxID=2663532 RepID=UPI0013D86E40|nr:AraC family transcriptional regulator [Gracilibacillus sp. YIM 98692]
MFKIEGVYHDVDPYWSTEKARGLYTFVYVTEGTVVYFIENKQIELEKGECLWIPDNLYRAWKNHETKTHRKYTVLFSTETHTLDFPLPFPKKDQLFRYTPRNLAYFEQRLSFLYVQWLGKRTYYEHLSSNILSELLLLISQERFEQNASPEKEKLVRKLQEYILYNFRENITIDELSKMAGISPNYVTVLFKEVIGVTPIQYLHQTRVNMAWNLFNNTQMTVKEAAEYLGYCDQSYFNRMFKKWMGIPPSQASSNKK